MGSHALVGQCSGSDVAFVRPPGEILQFMSHSYESRLNLQTIIEFVGFGEIQGLDLFW